MIVLPALGIALAAFAVMFVFLALHRSQATWQRPTLFTIGAEAQTKSRKPSGFLGWVKAVFTGPTLAYLLLDGLKKLAKPIYNAIIHVEKWTMGLLSHQLANGLKPVVAFFNSLANIAFHVPAAISALSQSTYNALSNLANDYMPAAIEDALAPVRKLATSTYTEVKAGTASIATTLTGLGWTTANDISTSLGNFGHAFENLWRYTRGQLTDAVASLSSLVGTLTDITIPRLESEVTGIGDDVRGILDEAIPGIEGQIDAVTDSISGLASQIGELAGEIPLEGAFAAAAVAAVELAAPELFCNGTRSAARKLCGLDTALLDGLLALSLAWLVVIDPEEIARLALGAEEIMEPIIERVAA